MDAQHVHSVTAVTVVGTFKRLLIVFALFKFRLSSHKREAFRVKWCVYVNAFISNSFSVFSFIFFFVIAQYVQKKKQLNARWFTVKIGNNKYR